MRVNVYEGDHTGYVAVIRISNESGEFTGLRFLLKGTGHAGADGDSIAAVTFHHRSPKRLLLLMRRAGAALDRHIAREQSKAGRRKPRPRPPAAKPAAPKRDGAQGAKPPKRAAHGGKAAVKRQAAKAPAR